MSTRITIGFTGDVMIGRGVNAAIKRHGYRYPWGNVLPLLTGNDVNIINLETTLTYSDRMMPKVFNFRSDPGHVQVLKEARITIACLANNHILDYSDEGLIETLSTLQQAGIEYAGAGRDAAEAAKPAMITCKGLGIGVLNYTDNEPGWKAGKQRPGTNYIDVESERDRERVLQEIKQLRRNVDILVVSLHWGYNMIEEPPSYFVSFAHEMLEAGADTIHGHSAHIFQGMERVGNKIVLYDTGDFVDDYAVDPVLRNNNSFLFILEAGKEGIGKVKLIPVHIDDCSVNIAGEIDRKWSIDRMKRLSSRFGTSLNEEGEVVMLTPQ